MTTRSILRPDADVVRALIAAGGNDVKKCYQCATCAVACPQTQAQRPFPRKEMIWASWGLRDTLAADIDLWLCHNCGQCAEQCPRGAHPADVMAAARTLVYRDLPRPRVVGTWLRTVGALPVLIGIPALLWLVVWWLGATACGQWFPRAADGRIVFGLIFSVDYAIDPIFGLTFAASGYVLYRSVRRLLGSFAPQGTLRVLGARKPWYAHLRDVLVHDVVLHETFTDCVLPPVAPTEPPAPVFSAARRDHDSRRWAHMALLYSFAALAVVTTVLAVGHWGGMFVPALGIETPMPLHSPLKILANTAAVAMLTALGWLTLRRLRLKPRGQRSSFDDKYLLGVLWAVALSGLCSEVCRLSDALVPAFCSYYLHLVSVWMLVAYAPWSKLGHAVYRTAALTYARAVGRSDLL